MKRLWNWLEDNKDMVGFAPVAIMCVTLLILMILGGCSLKVESRPSEPVEPSYTTAAGWPVDTYQDKLVYCVIVGSSISCVKK
jgi:hypothetical protein